MNWQGCLERSCHQCKFFDDGKLSEGAIDLELFEEVLSESIRMVSPLAVLLVQVMRWATQGVGPLVLRL